MTKHTIVIDFADADQPSYSAGMEVLGGKVVAVAFADELERAEQLEGQRDDLLEALELILETRIQEKHAWNWKPGESPLHDRCRAAIDAASAIADT